MGCMLSTYDEDLYLPLTPQMAPKQAICPALVVPDHLNTSWGFMMRHRIWSISGNDFTVHNQFGQDIVVVSGKMFSMRDKTMIRGLNGVPILEIQRKVFGFHSTHYLKDPKTGMTVATTRMKLGSMRPHIELFAGEEYKNMANHMLTMKGDFYGFRWSILNNRHECVAKAVQTNAMGWAPMLDQYFVDVAPGVDSLFVLAMVIIAEEIHDERERNRERNTYNAMYY